MTKDELKQYIKLEKELKQLEEMLEKLENEIHSPKITRLSDMPKGGKPVDIEDKIIKLIELRDIYNDKWDKLIDERKRIEQAIEKLQDPIQRALMRYKYIDGLTWEEVCVKLSYSWRQTHRMHSRALQNMA